MNNMRNKILSLLVLLLTAATGAWAQTQITQDFENGLGDWTMTNCNPNSGISSAYPPTHGGTNMFRFYFTANYPQYLISPEIDAAGGGTMSFYYARYDNDYLETFKVGYSTTTNDPTAFTWGNEETCTNTRSAGYLEYTYDIPAGAKYVAIAHTSIDQFYLFVDDITIDTAPAGPKVTFNEAKTEATMEMPGSDVTVEYELVRDLEQSVVFAGLPNTTQGTEILKKDGDKYTFATTPEIALVDAIDLENLLPITDAEGITLSVYPMVEIMEGYWKADETATPVALADFLASPQPGNWMIKAVAAAPSAYDGTLYSKKFTLAEAYDLTLSPANAENPYNIGKETAKGSVTVGQEEATPDEKGVIKGIEPGKKVKITTTGPDYIIRKATVKKTVKLQSIKIDGITIYYAEGDTWTTALQRDENKNCGVTIESGCMWSDTGILCDSDDAPVSADVEIKATESYSFQC